MKIKFGAVKIFCGGVKIDVGAVKKCFGGVKINGGAVKKCFGGVKNKNVQIKPGDHPKINLTFTHTQPRNSI